MIPIMVLGGRRYRNRPLHQDRQPRGFTTVRILVLPVNLLVAFLVLLVLLTQCCVSIDSFQIRPQKTRMIQDSHFLRKSLTSPWVVQDENNMFAPDFIQMQKDIAQNVVKNPSNAKNTSTPGQLQHNSHQQQVFDELASFFAIDDNILPPSVISRVEFLVQRIFSMTLSKYQENNRKQLPSSLRILDVACGTGVLFPFLIQEANRWNVTLDIVGIDLSSKMIQAAEERVVAMNNITTLHNPHTISLHQCDVCEYKISSEEQPLFDIIIANACFGNFYRPVQVLQHLYTLLREDGGALYVTHPLGASFVQELHAQDPSTVPHLLPSTVNEWRKLLRRNKMTPLLHSTGFVTHCQYEDNYAPVYLAGARKIRVQEWSPILRLRGKVANGYGRGGKKLGVPTANLPQSLFKQALQELQTGVYIGWAVIENGPGTTNHSIQGRNVQHKAVVNIGYSPTFEGQENKEKIVEAHLIVESSSEDRGDSTATLSDFYGETMRLQLIGFMRPEMKFPSFPELIAQIHADIEDTKEALDLYPYRNMKLDPFLINTVLHSDDPWVGQSGGDTTSSWEFEDFGSILNALPDYS